MSATAEKATKPGNSGFAVLESRKRGGFWTKVFHPFDHYRYVQPRAAAAELIRVAEASLAADKREDASSSFVQAAVLTRRALHYLEDSWGGGAAEQSESQELRDLAISLALRAKTATVPLANDTPKEFSDFLTSRFNAHFASTCLVKVAEDTAQQEPDNLEAVSCWYRQAIVTKETTSYSTHQIAEKAAGYFKSRANTLTGNDLTSLELRARAYQLVLDFLKPSSTTNDSVLKLVETTVAIATHPDVPELRTKELLRSLEDIYAKIDGTYASANALKATHAEGLARVTVHDTSKIVLFRLAAEYYSKHARGSYSADSERCYSGAYDAEHPIVKVAFFDLDGTIIGDQLKGLVQGITTVIDRLRANGFKILVTSNTPQVRVDDAITAAGLSDRIDGLFGVEQLHPEGRITDQFTVVGKQYERITATLPYRTHPTQMLVIGNNGGDACGSDFIVKNLHFDTDGTLDLRYSVGRVQRPVAILDTKLERHDAARVLIPILDVLLQAETVMVGFEGMRTAHRHNAKSILYFGQASTSDWDHECFGNAATIDFDGVTALVGRTNLARIKRLYDIPEMTARIERDNAEIAALKWGSDVREAFLHAITMSTPEKDTPLITVLGVTEAYKATPTPFE